MKHIAIFAAIALASCPPPLPPPDPPDAADASTPLEDASPPAPKPEAGRVDVYDAACSNLTSLGCPEGLRANCAAAMRAADKQITDFEPVCVAGAVTASSLRKCSPAWSKGCPVSLNRPLGASAPLAR